MNQGYEAAPGVYEKERVDGVSFIYERILATGHPNHYSFTLATFLYFRNWSTNS